MFDVLLTYNNKMVHSAHNMTPKAARKPRNEMNAKLNMSMNAKRNRIHPEVSEGDKGKILRKKGVGETERINTWSQNSYTIQRTERKLSQSHYYVEGMDKPDLRFELLIV